MAVRVCDTGIKKHAERRAQQNVDGGFGAWERGLPGEKHFMIKPQRARYSRGRWGNGAPERLCHAHAAVSRRPPVGSHSCNKRRRTNAAVSRSVSARSIMLAAPSSDHVGPSSPPSWGDRGRPAPCTGDVIPRSCRAGGTARSVVRTAGERCGGRLWFWCNGRRRTARSAVPNGSPRHIPETASR